ncbi:MAG TPA: hypothetical protein VF399_00805 [bacterium]
MAKYRPIFTKMWDDPDIQKLTAHEKLIFVYLCANDATSESGIYPVTYKTVAMSTDIGNKQVIRVLESGKLPNISYDAENSIVFIRNFLKYNGKGRKDCVLRSIYNDYIHNKTQLWDDFKILYPLWFKAVIDYANDVNNALKTLKDSPSPLPISIPSPNHNLNLTPNPNNAQNEKSIAEIPYEKMLSIFKNYWRDKNSGDYVTLDEDAEREDAMKMYQWCCEQNEANPLGLFEERVYTLITKYDVKTFSGLWSFWNGGGTRPALD